MSPLTTSSAAGRQGKARQAKPVGCMLARARFPPPARLDTKHKSLLLGCWDKMKNIPWSHSSGICRLSKMQWYMCVYVCLYMHEVAFWALFLRMSTPLLNASSSSASLGVVSSTSFCLYIHLDEAAQDGGLGVENGGAGGTDDGWAHTLLGISPTYGPWAAGVDSLLWLRATNLMSKMPLSSSLTRPTLTV